MSIPGLSLPGLSLSNPIQAPTPTVATPRLQNLSPETEYRFECSSTITIKLLSGAAELFGTEISPNTPYTFKGTKGAIFTWQGCNLEITGDTEGEYVAEETPMVQYSNVHFALDNMRNDAKSKGEMGPRVLIVGPENSGKTSLVKMLTAYAVKSNWEPAVINLDPRQGMLSVPGALSTTTFASLLDVEEGWGSSPISGPSALPVKMPLAYHFGCATAEENPKLYKALVTRLALAVTSRMEDDENVKSSGFFIDTPGSISSGKGNNYDLIQHIASEFSVNAILVIGAERLFNEMKRRFFNTSSEDPVTVVRLDKSGGCVDRDESYMKQLRQQQIREYFFGHGTVNLSPYTNQVDYVQLAIYRIIDSANANSFNPGGDDDDDIYDTSKPHPSSTGTLYEKIMPSLMLQNSLLAVTYADQNDSQDNIRDASVMGYVYVVDVDESKRRVKLLGPVSGRLPNKAMVWGSWPEEVIDLV